MYLTPISGDGGASRAQPITRYEPAADAAPTSVDAMAADWQVVLDLRALIKRSPRSVMTLLDRRTQVDSTVNTLVFLAVREAAAAQPQDAELAYAAAWAAAFAGRTYEARQALRRCLELDADHAEALSLLMQLGEA